VEVITDLTVSPWPHQRSVVTIGAYDGVHLGHRTIIAEVCRRAAARDARSVVVTFDRHPASVVRPESAPKMLTDLDQKLEVLADTGVDATCVVRFDEERSHESAHDFVSSVLVSGLRASAIVVGEDFHFGRNRSGNVALLRELGSQWGFDVEGLPLVAVGPGERPVSSTAIRAALASGAVEQAATMLGRPFEARGPVVRGDQRGRLIGFPTANVEVPRGICLPADGVYAGWYERPDGSVHPCAINLGRRPTFYESAEASLLEAHLMGFDGDLYGELAKVRFTNFLRAEQKFSGIDELKLQLAVDLEQATKHLAP
jgi:riboflavin kinase/FMN adenylyltransferase